MFNFYKLIVATQAVFGADWDYNLNGADWEKIPGYEACGGQNQSPIDLRTTGGYETFS